MLYLSEVAIQSSIRKKRYQQQLEEIKGTILTLKQQREALESVNTNAATLIAMKAATNALQLAQKNM